MFTEPITELITKRTSWRSYNEEPLGENDREQLQRFIDSDLGTPFGSTPRFAIIDSEAVGRLGTFGFIGGAKQFIVGTAQETPMGIEDYGYALEKVMLFATQLGLGTCWLGGTYNKQGFSDALGHTGVIPAITPVGYPKERRIAGRLIRWAAGARNRKQWSELFFKEDLSPLTIDGAGEYATALEMVRLAPSASNGQPWRIYLDGNRFHFHIKPRKGYGNMNRLDMGIAMSHFDLTLAEQEVHGKWTNEPRENLEKLVYSSTWTRTS
jgi:nitroreductase